MMTQDNISVCYPYVLNPTGGSLVSTELLALHSNSIDARFVLSSEGSAVQSLENNGLTVDILQPSSEIRKELNESNTLVDELSLGFKMSPYLFRIRRYIKKNSIDIIHTNDVPSTIIWGLSSLGLKTPVIFHIRGEKPNIYDPICLFLSDHLIFVAESNKSRFDRNKLKRIPHTTVYNGVDMNTYARSVDKPLRDELDLGQNVNLVGFVGNLVSRKRPMLFVKSAVELLKERDDTHFIIVGRDKGQYSSKIRDYANKHNSLSNFHMLGYRDDIPQIMNSIDILLLTSTKKGEAFPRVPLEAMAVGTPVITSNTAGVSEAVDNFQTGFILSADPSLAEIKNGTEILLTNEQLLKEFSDNAVTLIGKDFTAEQTAENISKIYHKYK
jgi:glycosyltransferase involved in cell wall biosynthesis